MSGHMTLSKSEVKRINALKIKKYRSIEGLFIAEGQKIILDLIQSGYFPVYLFATEAHIPVFTNFNLQDIRMISISDLEKISCLKQSSGCLAVFKIPSVVSSIQTKDWVLAVDNIQDPGNLGTIIRIADWFGIPHVVCSEGTVDAFNPKVIQATMGSIAHVQVHYYTLNEWFTTLPSSKPVYAGLLDGQDISQISFTIPGVILIGNEGNGISTNLLPFITQPVYIPKLGKAESLNAGVAAGIIASFALLKH